MDENHSESEGLPAVVEPGDQAVVLHDDLERLRREVTAPAIVCDAGPQAEYAYADFFKARISNSNTRKAYKRAVDRFLGPTFRTSRHDISEFPRPPLSTHES